MFCYITIFTTRTNIQVKNIIFLFSKARCCRAEPRGRCWPIGKRKEEASNALRIKLACRSITPRPVPLTNGTSGIPCIRHRSFICYEAYSLLFHRLVIHGRTGTLCCKSLSVHVSTINCVLGHSRSGLGVSTSRPRFGCGSMTSCPERTGHTQNVTVRVPMRGP